MTPKQFAKYLKRDSGRCYHCGIDDDTLVPQHRATRGLGGSKEADIPSNIITFCSLANGLIESNSYWQAQARMLGWKISKWQTPSENPVYDMSTQKWYLLDDEFNRVERPIE